MKYLCTNCNYIYDEWLWEREEWIKKWTKLQDIENFYCPSCYWHVDHFHEIKDEINYINEENRDSLELEHIPQIKIIDDKNSMFWRIIQVFVWEEEHAMWEDHFIKSVSLYYPEWEMIEEKFLSPWDDPVIEFDFYDLEEYEIRIDCSMHWVWWFRVK